jgi:hypothetical protein
MTRDAKTRKDFRFLKSAHFAIFAHLFVRRLPVAELFSRNWTVLPCVFTLAARVNLHNFAA